MTDEPALNTSQLSAREQAEAPKPDIIDMAPMTQMVRSAPIQDLMITAAFDVETAQKRLKELQQFVQMYMHEGEDYGTIPGTPKPTLYKPGADKLCDIYALADSYRVTNRTENWDASLFDYEIECRLLSKRTGQLVATGLGSCNSFEGKYRWRDQQRTCPKCGKTSIIKGKEEYGGGWLCWKKKDGCGAKFEEGDQSIEGQPSGKVQNDDIPTLKNTILKMAKKRAKVDAVLSATRSSGLFTQDIEDWTQVEQVENGSKQEANLVADKKLRDAAKGQVSVTLVEWKEGLVALQGHGVAIVRANLTPAEKQKFTFKHDRTGNCWTIPTGEAFAFSDVCKKYEVECEWADKQV